jgi:hypothetical protein
MFNKFFSKVGSFGRKALSTTGSVLKRVGDIGMKIGDFASKVSPAVSTIASVIGQSSNNPTIKNVANAVAKGTAYAGTLGKPLGHLVGETGRYMSMSADGKGNNYNYEQLR